MSTGNGEYRLKAHVAVQSKPGCAIMEVQIILQIVIVSVSVNLVGSFPQGEVLCVKDFINNDNGGYAVFKERNFFHLKFIFGTQPKDPRSI